MAAPDASCRPLTRGRGSKQITITNLLSAITSPAHTRAWIETASSLIQGPRFGCRPLTRGRGSKHCQAGQSARCGCRPLTRGRGSKRPNATTAVDVLLSPAHTRAWIETMIGRRPWRSTTGRPLTRGRGSKHGMGSSARRWRRSPAHTWAWIETFMATQDRSDKHVARSHAGVDRNNALRWSASHYSCRPLTRGRGSKRVRSFPTLKHRCRPLTRGRGSKQSPFQKRDARRWSPAHTRAWIETRA